MAHPQIAIFARLAKENSKPARVLAGQMTKLSRTMHIIHYDSLHDEFVVSNPFSQAILTFQGGANGEEPPIRVIQGPSTGMDAPDKFAIDPIHNEIFVPLRDKILVFPRLANGDVAPIRTMHGDWDVSDMDADPVHNLIVAMGSAPGQEAGSSTYYQGQGRGIYMFNRTDNGEVKPRAVISGSNTGLASTRQVAVNPEKGYIFVSQALTGAGQSPDWSKLPGAYFVGVWSVNDNGNVAPRWKIGGPKSELVRPRGVALNPKHKEVMVADMLRNAVLTYYFPEVF